ncbi:MAG: zf-HC2 domain-containing protein [Planctomycetes bacterium]|nr:zf-HC2 domain-containing protein [Planctomycetota bacterium]
MSTRCDQVRQLLPWFVGGDLAEARRTEVRAHLAACASCRREASALLRATKALRSLQLATPRLDEATLGAMHGDILAAVQQEAARQEVAVERLVRVRSWFVVAALLLVGLGLWVGLERRPSSLRDRPPMATPVSVSRPPLAVPYAGPRGEWHLLGDDSATESDRFGALRGEDREFGAEASRPGFEEGLLDDTVGQGLLGRDRLRPLIEDQFSQTLRLRRGQTAQPGRPQEPRR